MRLALRALLAGALGIAVAFLVACGDRSHLLPGSSADKLNSQLDQVSAAVSGHDCAKALSAVNAYKDTVLGLPGTVSPTLRANLLQGAQTIAEMAPHDCRESSTPTTPTTSTPTNTAPATTQSTPSTPTDTTTTPAPTTSTPPPPPPPTQQTTTTPPETQPPSTGTNGGGGAPPPGNSGGGAGAGGAGTGNG